jgi:transcriptional regulator with XRE-family HTH domain
MATRERPADRGQRLGHAALVRIGAELRAARTACGLSIDQVALALGISNAEVSRIERARSPNAPAITLFRFAAVVGLDLVLRSYAGPSRLRDGAHIELLGDFRALLHKALGWATEVPLPIPGDQRAWDGTVRGPDWLFGVEAETAPRDGQALARRLQLKLRDGGVDGVLLLVRDTRAVRQFLAEAADLLQPELPIMSREVLARLRVGARPDRSAIVVVPRRRAARTAR